jgi:hypothetical protein
MKVIFLFSFFLSLFSSFILLLWVQAGAGERRGAESEALSQQVEALSQQVGRERDQAIYRFQQLDQLAGQRLRQVSLETFPE